MVMDPDREALYAQLKAKLSGVDPLAADRKEIGDEERKNLFLASLNQSANQMGAVGGRTVKDTALAPLAAGLAQSNAAGLKDRADVLGDQDKVRSYLLSKLDRKDEMKDQMDARAQERQDSLQNQQKLAENEHAFKRDMFQREQTAKADFEKNKVQNDDKAFVDLATKMNPGLAGSRSDFGKQQSMVSAADRVLTLGQQVVSQPGGADKRQIHELAIASANLVSGGGSGAAQSTIEALVPHSYGATAAGIEEWLTGNPTGTEQQQFVKRMLETADREKAMAVDKVKGIQSAILAASSHLKNKDPDRFNSIQQRYFGPDAKFDPYGNYVSNAPAPGPHAGPEPGTAMAAPAFPRTVINKSTGHQATVSSPEELKEAQTAGFE